MHTISTKILTPALFALTFTCQLITPMTAESRNYYYVRPYHHYGVYQSHPVLSRTLTGTAIGAAGGAVVGAMSGGHRHHNKIAHDALIGAGVGTVGGLGYGLLRNHQYHRRYF